MLRLSLIHLISSTGPRSRETAEAPDHEPNRVTFGTGGQFVGTAWVCQAVQRRRNNSFEIDDISEMLQDEDEYRRRVIAALKSPFTRDIHDGIMAAKKYELSFADYSIFETTYRRTLDERDWVLIAADPESTNLTSSLWLIRMELVLLAGKAQSAAVVPLLIDALGSDLDVFAIESIAKLGTLANEALTHLINYVDSDFAVSSEDAAFRYHVQCKLDACRAITAIS